VANGITEITFTLTDKPETSGQMTYFYCEPLNTTNPNLPPITELSIGSAWCEKVQVGSEEKNLAELKLKDGDILTFALDTGLDRNTFLRDFNFTFAGDEYSGLAFSTIGGTLSYQLNWEKIFANSWFDEGTETLADWKSSAFTNPYDALVAKNHGYTPDLIGDDKKFYPFPNRKDVSYDPLTVPLATVYQQEINRIFGTE